ncbi:MAG: hypothetical protein RI945_167 [Candidatus Parcubacteria bacterium]|jgi:hypothetical protein
MKWLIIIVLVILILGNAQAMMGISNGVSNLFNGIVNTLFPQGGNKGGIGTLFLLAILYFMLKSGGKKEEKK